MVADLFHAEDLRDDDPSSATGVSTIGSSEAVMLGGLALNGAGGNGLAVSGKTAPRIW
jgi:glutamate decarboxylase